MSIRPTNLLGVKIRFKKTAWSARVVVKRKDELVTQPERSVLRGRVDEEDDVRADVRARHVEGGPERWRRGGGSGRRGAR